MWPTNLSAPSRPCASNGKGLPRHRVEAPRAASPDPWPAEAACGTGRAQSLPCLFPDAGLAGGPPSPLFSPTHPTQGVVSALPSNGLYLGGQADKFQLWANRLFAFTFPVPSPMGQRPN